MCHIRIHDITTMHFKHDNHSTSINFYEVREVRVGVQVSKKEIYIYIYIFKLGRVRIISHMQKKNSGHKLQLRLVQLLATFFIYKWNPDFTREKKKTYTCVKNL